MNQKPLKQVIKVEGKEITLETGIFGAQANGAVTARCGDTMVLAAVVSGAPREGIDFFPLQVEYREKHYAGGIISSSRFIKREGRPSDNEILTSRLIDRSIRPLFPKELFDEVQVVVSPLSIDGVNEPEILAILASSAALAISDIPWSGPVGAVRVGLVNDKFVLNPLVEEKLTSKLDLVLSGSRGSIAMVEAGSQEVSETQMIEAMEYGQKVIDQIVTEIEKFAEGHEKREIAEIVVNDKTQKLVDGVDSKKILEDSKTAGGEGLNLGQIVKEMVGEDEEIDAIQLARLIDEKVRLEVRHQILEEKVRLDNRKLDEIRTIKAQVGLLPRTHGSAFFQRGLTHALSVATLGSPEDEQLIEGMKGEETKRYMHHYNMPGFASGEPGRIGSPNRREIGHGALAERALIPVLPSQEEFPYTIRVVSEIMSSNGSTSQASVCGSTLALMDAGVPIKKPVAGIAMGLISDEKKQITLSDIAGLEDHFGDMDFKVAGTADGITAMQMDVKVPGVTAAVLKTALEQARVGRLHILSKMLEAINEPRKEISKYAPRIDTFKIDPEKIGSVIGSGGKTIRQIQADFGVDVGIEDDGTVNVTGTDADAVIRASKYVQNLVAGPEIGKVYEGTVKRLMDFGAFVEFLPGQEGLVHVSNMGKGFVGKPSDVVKEGEKVTVKVWEVDSQGRVNLTMDLEGEPNKGRRGGGSERPGHRDVYDRRERGSSSGRPGPSRFKRFSDHR